MVVNILDATDFIIDRVKNRPTRSIIMSATPPSCLDTVFGYRVFQELEATKTYH